MDDERSAMMSSISLRLYDVLNHVGLSEEVRWKRRQLAAEMEVIQTLRLQDQNMSQYIFGSQSEGTTTSGLGSDIDILSCYEDKNVIQTLDEWTPGCPNLLMIQEEWTKPGYIKLWVCDFNVPQPLTGYYGDTFVYDMFDKVLMSPSCFPCHEIFEHNGPAATLIGPSISADSVPAFRCRSWPQQAQDWFLRRRQNNWPSQASMSHIKTYGCFLVAVGYPYSEERELEWKISFSLSERNLMWNLNEIQFKCYVLLKLIVKSFFKPVMKESICSYHCKMCIFYVAENIPERLWSPKNLLLCVSKCLQYLLKCLENGNLPHYFMPEHNLFEHKVHGEIRIRSHSILQQLILEDFGFLQRIACDNIGQLLCSSCNSAVLQMVRFTISQSTYANIGQMTVYSAAGVASFHVHCISNNDIVSLYPFLVHLDELSHSENTFIRNGSKCLFPFVMAKILFVLISRVFDPSNIVRDQSLHVLWTGMGIIRNGSVSGMLTTKLKLASISCVSGNFHETVTLLEDIAVQKDKCLINACQCSGVACINNSLRIGQTLLDNNSSLMEITYHLLSTCVIYSRDEIWITPNALKYEMFRSVGDEEPRYEPLYHWYNCAVIDSPIYMYFIQYCCYGMLAWRKDQYRALKNMIFRIKKKTNLGHIETAFNILAQCLIRKNMESAAYKCLIYSMMFRRAVPSKAPTRSPHHHNAAKWHLAILLNKTFRGS